MSAYRTPPAEPMIDATLAVCRELLRRGVFAHVHATEDRALIQAYDPEDGITVLGAVSLPEIPGTIGCEVAPFLADVDAKLAEADEDRAANARGLDR